MSSVGESTGEDLSSVFGPIYWGFIVSLFLGGITVIQAWIYFPHPNDRISIQLTAVAMLLLDLASSGLVAQSIYYYLVPHFGATFQFGSVTPELSAECLLSGIMTFISQMYFVRQLYTVNHPGGKVNRLLIAVITICAILAFLGGTSCGVAMYIFKHGVLSNRNSMFAIFFGLAKGFGAITDIIATIAMCRFLTDSQTTIEPTNYMLKSLVRFIVERGVLVTLIQTLLLITFYAAPTRLYWFAFHMNVTKLYANTFFAMLNARSHLRNLTEKHLNMRSSYTPSRNIRFRSRFPVSGNRDSFCALDLEEGEAKEYPIQVMQMPAVPTTVVVHDL